MTEKYKILGKYIKDMSSETRDLETFLFVRDRISKYQLGIDIISEALKDKLIEDIEDQSIGYTSGTGGLFRSGVAVGKLKVDRENN